jgi:hypothetical protein
MTSRRRKIAGGIAALALAAGLVAAGSLAAQAVPTSVTITTGGGPRVGPGPHIISGDITWADAAGGTLTVTVANSDGSTPTPCLNVPYTGFTTTSWNCDVTSALEYGDNTITATAEDADAPLTSSPIVITYGGTQPASISSPPDGSTNSVAQTFSGTASQMGTVTLRARPFGSTNPADFVDICAPTPVDAGGNWSCLASFPERRIWTVQAQSVTLTGLDYGPPASQTFTFNNERPDTTVVSTPGLLRLDATPGATGSTVSTIWRYYADSLDGGSVVANCPIAASQACLVPGTPLAGLYLASSNAYANDAGSSDRGDFVRIPAAPVITSFDDSVPGQLTVFGTFDPTFSEPFGQVTDDGTPVVDLFNADTSAMLCGDIELALNGDWNCTTPAPAGTFDYVTIARTSTPIGTSNVQDVFSVGTSSRSNVITTTVAQGLRILSPANGSSPSYAPDPMVFSGDTPLPADVQISVEGPYPFGDSCIATPDGGGAWSCNISSFPTPPVGAYTVTASQSGTPNDVITFTRILPTPDFNGPYYLDVGTGVTAFGGQNLYSTAGTSFWIDDGPSCVSPEGGTSGTWSCSIDVSGLAVGNYPMHFRNFDSADPTLDSATGTAVLTIEDPGGPGQPTMNCGFSPNGGFSASSPHVMNSGGFWLSRVYLDGGSFESGEQFGIQGVCSGSSGSAFPVDDDWLLFETIQHCEGSCSTSGLEPGLYEVYYTVSDTDETPGVSFEPHSYLFTVPEAPAITTASSTTNSVIIRGTATPNDAVRIVRPNGTQLCATTATGVGTWACQFPKSSTSSARAIAVDPPSGGMSAYSAARSIPIAAAPVVDEEIPTLSAWFLEFGGDLANLKPGDTFTLNVSGMPEGTEIEVWMHSDPYLLGTATGTGLPIAMELQVPEDIESGAHEIEMIAVTPLGTNYFYTSDAMVSGGATPTEGDKPLDVEADPEDAQGGTGSGGGTGQRDDPAAPSGITGTVAPLQAILDNPSAIAVAGGLALALLFLVALPTELLNSSLSSNTSRLGRVYGAFDSAMTRAQNWLIKKTHSRALVAIILVAIVAVIYGFVDPGFGFDIVSLRLVLSLAIAFFLLSFVASWVSGIIIRRAWGAMAIVALQPSIILFAVVGVIVARILDFSPGFLVGVAIGLELLQASKHVAARAVFVQIAVVTGFSLAAWITYSFFSPGNDFFGMLLEDTMVATTAEGLTGALIAVFPLKFLDGRELWEVSKRLWAAAFLIVGTAFALLVLPTAISGTNVSDIVTWLIVFAVFGGVSFAVWLIFVRADKKASAAGKEKVDA